MATILRTTLALALVTLSTPMAARVRPLLFRPLRRTAPTMQFFGRPGNEVTNPYETLGVQRDASAAEIKKAFREKAVSTHPDRNPDLDPEAAQARFTAVGEAYEILKNPAKREEYDTFGRVGGSGGMGGGAGGSGAVDMEALFRELMRQQGGQGFEGQGVGGPRPPPPKPFPQPDMEAWIRAEEESIRRASRASNISEAKDDVRARFAGTLGMVSLVDPRDKTVKVRVMVSPGRAAEVWYPIEALWDARHMKKGAAVLICADELAIAKASRGSGIGVEKDAVRASCAGKPGTVLEVDTADQSCKVRVIVEPGQATICWFPIAATEPRVAGL